MKCDRCGSENVRPKTITAKDGRKWNKFECQNGCMDGKWKYSFFDNTPKEQKYTQTQKPQQSNHQLAEIIRLLSDINNKLGGKLSITNDELKPDNEVPF